MNVSIDAAAVLERSVSKGQNRRIALWCSILIVMALTTGRLRRAGCFIDAGAACRAVFRFRRVPLSKQYRTQEIL